MSDPISTEDLYGTTKKDSPDSGTAPTGLPVLPVEETPEIPMDVEDAQSTNNVQQDSQGQHSLPPVGYLPKRSGSVFGGIGKTVVFIVLFAAGIWLSSFVRQYLPQVPDIGIIKRNPTPSISPVPSLAAVISPKSATSSAWKSYDVISGVSGASVENVKLFLPPEVLQPICDGINCVSQGTYLPGGSRFTIAARGPGRGLPDYRGTVISDVEGITFTTKQTTIVGRQVMEFTGVFTGRTISGYAFSKMRGFMIPITDVSSVEVNHFTPSGIAADFEADDILFDEIVKKISIQQPNSQDKGGSTQAVTPIVTRAPTDSISPSPASN